MTFCHVFFRHRLHCRKSLIINGIYIIESPWSQKGTFETCGKNGPFKKMHFSYLGRLYYMTCNLRGKKCVHFQYTPFSQWGFRRKMIPRQLCNM